MESLWPLFRAVAAEGEPAWPPLAAELFARLLPIAARQPIGRLRRSEDTPREILTAVLERLRAKEFATIGKLCAMEPPPKLEAWLRILVRHAAIDFMRASPEFERGSAQRDPRWISLATLTTTAPGAAQDSLAEKRTILLAFMRAAVERAAAEYAARGEDALGALSLEWDISRIHVRRLVQRGEQYLQVLGAVLAGHSYPQVADKLGVSRREVELCVHYIEELLTARKFAG